jgi:hypothetical protein
VTGTVPDRTTLTRHKKLQKAESLELRHIQHALGFPLAPNVLGVGKKDIDDDLEMAKKLIEEDLEALGVSFVISLVTLMSLDSILLISTSFYS